MPGRINGFSIAYTAFGGVVLWSGIKGEKISDTFRGVLSGQPPAGGQEPIQPPLPAADSGGSGSGSGGSTGTATITGATGSVITDDAVKYKGHAYLYGGAPGKDGSRPWDCSSFANWVLGHDFGMKLPGSSSAGYSGTSHGPNTLLYLGWGAATTVSHSAKDAQAGDLLVWQTHMGFALGGGQMISALNERLGTRVTSIAGGSPGAEVLYVRRLKGSTSATNPYPGGISGRA